MAKYFIPFLKASIKASEMGRKEQWAILFRVANRIKLKRFINNDETTAEEFEKALAIYKNIGE